MYVYRIFLFASLFFCLRFDTFFPIYQAHRCARELFVNKHKLFPKPACGQTFNLKVGLGVNIKDPRRTNPPLPLVPSPRQVFLYPQLPTVGCASHSTNSLKVNCAMRKREKEKKKQGWNDIYETKFQSLASSLSPTSSSIDAHFIVAPQTRLPSNPSSPSTSMP